MGELDVEQVAFIPSSYHGWDPPQKSLNNQEHG